MVYPVWGSLDNLVSWEGKTTPFCWSHCCPWGCNIRRPRDDVITLCAHVLSMTRSNAAAGRLTAYFCYIYFPDCGYVYLCISKLFHYKHQQVRSAQYCSPLIACEITTELYVISLFVSLSYMCACVHVCIACDCVCMDICVCSCMCCMCCSCVQACLQYERRPYMCMSEVVTTISMKTA